MCLSTGVCVCCFAACPVSLFPVPIVGCVPDHYLPMFSLILSVSFYSLLFCAKFPIPRQFSLGLAPRGGGGGPTPPAGGSRGRSHLAAAEVPKARPRS